MNMSFPQLQLICLDNSTLPSKTDDSITDKYFRSQLHGSCQQQLQLYQSGKFAQSGRAELLASPAATLLWGSST